MIESTQWQRNLTGSPYYNGAVFGDIDNDGDLDLISIGCAEGFSVCTTADKSYVFINNGTSFIENFTWEQNLSKEGTGSIALGDIDNDGDLDLILTGGYASITKIYTNNGTSFEENLIWQRNISNEASSSSVALGDIDNDGDLDLLFPDMDTPSRNVYINNGTNFVNDTIWGKEITNPDKISTGLIDMNNDGFLDLNVHGQDSAKSYINNRSSFSYNSTWNLIFSDEAPVIWGDYDNDGDMDVISSGTIENFALNNLNGFIDGSSWDYDIMEVTWGSLAFGDYDNNGYLDLVLTGSSGGTSYIQIGNNNGTFFARDTTAESNLTGEKYGSVIWGDVDNDGDLDLVSIISQKVYINNITTPNTPPTSPTSFSNSYSNREINLGWSNGSDAETISTGLYYNLMIGNSTNNHTIISGIYGGSGDATRGGTAFGYFGNMMQRKNFTLNVDRLSASTTYYWYVQTIDTGLKAGNWSAMQSFTTPDDMDKPTITLNAPADYYNSSSYIISFNASIFDRNLTNVSLWGNWSSGWHLNETNSSGLNNTYYIFTKNFSSIGEGTYTWMIRAWDNSSNSENSSIRTFTIDATNPMLNITSPANNTNSSNIGLDIKYTASDTHLAYCWYSNDSYSVNTSLGTMNNCANITTITWSQGSHNISIWANDSFGNVNLSYISFFIDSIYPQIRITTPANNTNSSNNNLNINYSFTEANPSTCWYSNDSYSVNTTISCGNNITSLTWSEETHNLTLWINDTTNNVNSTYIVFTIDATYPLISIVSPLNNTNQTDSSLDIKYTFTEANPSTCWYSNDSYSSNTTLASCGTNITSLTWSEGTHNITIWINDTVSNVNSSYIYFTIDSVYPEISIKTPTNNTNSSNNNLNINYSFTEANPSTCWYSNDSYSSNTTLASCGTNITTINWTDGKHNLTIWINDTTNNVNSSSINFMIDTNYPVVKLISPEDSATWTSSSSVTFSYNVSDVDIANCSLIIDNAVDQTDTTITENTTQTFTKTLTNADYIWSVNCTDYVGYTNDSVNRSLSVDYTAPSGGTGGAGGSGGGTTTKNVTILPKEFDIDFSDVSSGSFEAKQGDIKTFSFNSETKHTITILTLTFSSITMLITSEPITIQISVGETKQIDINKDNINDFEIKFVSISGGKANLLLTKLSGADIVADEESEEAVRKEALFDVKVNVLDKFKEVFSGEEVSAGIEVLNINNIGQVDVVVNYYLSDNESVFGSGGSDTLAVEAVASFVRSLIVPEDLNPGIYYFNVNVSYKNFTTSGKAEFKVKSKKLIFIEKKWKEIVIIGIGAAALIAVIVFISLKIIRKKEDRLEKEERKIKNKENKLEKKQARLERIIRKLRGYKK